MPPTPTSTAPPTSAESVVISEQWRKIAELEALVAKLMKAQPIAPSDPAPPTKAEPLQDQTKDLPADEAAAVDSLRSASRDKLVARFDVSGEDRQSLHHIQCFVRRLKTIPDVKLLYI